MKPIRLTVLSLCLALATFGAEAETWPAKPLKAIVPFAAGSLTDIVPRLVFDQLSQQIGQGIIVENRAGAGGTTGANAVAKSAPDGYTMLAPSSAYTIAPALHPNLGYDPVRDLAESLHSVMRPSLWSSRREEALRLSMT